MKTLIAQLTGREIPPMWMEIAGCVIALFGFGPVVVLAAVALGVPVK